MTNEPLRRRSTFWQGLVLILLGIFTALQAVYFGIQDRGQQECVEDKFRELSAVLETRTQLGSQAARLKEQDVQLTQDQFDWLLELFVTSASNPNPTEEERAALRKRFLEQVTEFQDRQKDLDQRIAEVAEEQAKHPVPPYPVGTCGE